MPLHYNIYPLGDHAITIELDNIIDEQVNDHCLAIAALLAQQHIHGVKDIVTAYCTVSVIYDPAAIFHLPNIVSPCQYIKQQTEAVLSYYQPVKRLEAATITIPACFDPAFATDLPLMSEQKSLSTGEIIDLFTAKTYRVYLVGFLPGFAYMGKVDDTIAVPRKEKPVGVLPGSIAIAGNQAGIYPLTSPGGWNIIGRTPLRLFDKDAEDLCLLKSGDHVVFEPISIATFHHLNQNP